MALDAIAVRCVVDELNSRILDCRIDKIYQPERDEIVLHAKGKAGGGTLLISANAANARVNLTERSMVNPMNAPMFCMVLRKHLQGGRIVSVDQPDTERIIEIGVESYDELGDKTSKRLTIEIMGRHSNIILINKDGVIIDSIKHITHEMSRVRQVLPGLLYAYPPKQDKIDPFSISKSGMASQLAGQPASMSLEQALSSIINGISRSTATEIAAIAGINGDLKLEQITLEVLDVLWDAFEHFRSDVVDKRWQPAIIYDEQGNPVDFFPLPVHRRVNGQVVYMQSISQVLERYYAQKDAIDHIKQKSSDLRKLLNTHLERAKRKLEIQQRELAQTKDMDRYKLYGQLITSNLYQLQPGQSEAKLVNFYSQTMDELTISLDPSLTPAENAQRYFKLYNKAKNAAAALIPQIEQTRDEIEYLESQLDNLERCTEETDIDEIRQELSEQGYIKHRRKNSDKSKAKPSQPHHFVSSTGMDIYVGKNNVQNDMLTLRWAAKSDYWLHVKDLPGSHVIIRSQGKLPDQQTLLEAAMLAAHYSKGRDSSNVAVDYTQCKYVNKPAGARPGKVIYTNYKTIYVTPDTDLLKKLNRIV
ncbi:Rqc2 family fibronectin-binding protein [Mahella australiensis]|uniref:Rqc2 homolog RqcH n=1 Tax=Mahella australiensis (strain DSM 15567 / CIP 107919 / 50-1 BON) TaxID=697281 RepID=F4A2C7_MAHA5|nr:NFACT RNA binding domain-containing protein [Mahella australiensis]AEE96174.1 Fibronectin-binding A domain protein [Mahella australiensis 50-1 BON]